MLAQIARDYYCVPATSASSERAFSQAGLVVVPKRTKLAIKTIEMLCFINQNYNTLEPFVTQWKVTSDTEITEAKTTQESLDSDSEPEPEEPEDDDAEPAGQELIGPTMPLFTPLRDRNTPRGKGPGPSKRSKPEESPQAGSSTDFATPKRPRK